jgi:integrase
MPGIRRLKSDHPTKGGVFAYTARGRLRWGVEYRDPGSRRMRRKVGFEKKSQADAFALKQERKRLGLLPLEPAPKSFKEAAKEYVDHRTAQGKVNASYAQLLRRWVPEFDDRPLHTITTAEVRARLDSWTKDFRWSPATRNNVLNQLTGLFSFALAQDPPWLGKHPTERGRVPLLEVDNARERWLQLDEVKAIAAKCEPWLADIVWFAVASGWRLEEVCEVQKSDYREDRDGNAWLERRKSQTKTGEPLRFPLEGWLATFVKARVDLRKFPASRVFPGPKGGNARMSIRRDLPAAVKKAKLVWGRYETDAEGDRVLNPAGITFHTFRHTMASQALQAGLDVRRVQELGNWKDERMVRRYAHLADSARRDAARALADALDPNPQSRSGDSESSRRAVAKASARRARSTKKR